ncbi:class I SAM-dependent methyltransferase [Nocardiopsis exhalans]|uniref:Class I SAM-dependent methyltransferase n=1 Tax=Nocardiopsis exhalans TaxID=163604 RepID=A0ABY5D088_9ACTN|nr:class I SAM-dependent methyltransferase [Nocardiopsis exhalans]USY17287.1 class I SAM-dependent methyltransferase [Nocardiopsis exhalans]
MRTPEHDDAHHGFDEDGEAAARPPLPPWAGPDPDLSFLAPARELVDWRLALAYEAAAETGTLDVLPGTPSELAARCGLHEGALRAVLRELAVWGIVTEDTAGRYREGPQAPAAPDDAVLLRHAATIRRWAALIRPRLEERTYLPEGLTGRPLAPKPTVPNLLAVNARRLTRTVVDVCLERFPDAESVLDLGGGHGEHALEFARRGLKATVQDLPALIALAEGDERLRDAGVELFAGDLHASLPEGPYDLVFCSTVTNMFDGPANESLYRRLRSVIAPGGGLAIVSYMGDRDQVTAAFGLQMLAWTDSGDAHGVADYEQWLERAGYDRVSVRHLERPPQSVVLARR